MARFFETLGNIIKEEKLVAIKDKKLPSTCVLEMEKPFSAYHHELPSESVPGTVFLITTKFYSREDITRATQNIKRYASFEFDAASGQIFIYNDVYSFIRIKDLNDYNAIQSNFMNEGISFCKNVTINAIGIIKVKKYFSFEEVNENVFLDNIDKNMGYFKIPDQLTWKLFYKITQNVKNNWDGKQFDAAIGSFYRHLEMVDVVRIFNTEMNSELLSKLYILYLREIANI